MLQGQYNHKHLIISVGSVIFCSECVRNCLSPRSAGESHSAPPDLAEFGEGTPGPRNNKYNGKGGERGREREGKRDTVP